MSRTLDALGFRVVPVTTGAVSVPCLEPVATWERGLRVRLHDPGTVVVPILDFDFEVGPDPIVQLARSFVVAKLAHGLIAGTLFERQPLTVDGDRAYCRFGVLFLVRPS